MKRLAETEVRPVPFEATLWRVVSSRFASEGLLSLAEPKRWPSRFAPAGVRCLYASEDKATAWAELTSFFNVPVGRGDFIEIQIRARLSCVLDLSRSDVVETLGTTREELLGPAPALTQALGLSVYESGQFEAIRFRSRARPDATSVCLFRVFAGSTVEVIQGPGKKEATVSVGECLGLALEDDRLRIVTAGTMTDRASPMVQLFRGDGTSIITAFRRQYGLITDEAVTELENLLNLPETKELDLQGFLERHEDFLRYFVQFGVVYPHVALREVGAARKVPDFVIVDRDLCKSVIVELKLPSAKLVRQQRSRDRLSSCFYEARSQLLRYRDCFRQEENREKLAQLLGLEIYEPLLAVIIGRSGAFDSDAERQTLRADNPDVEIATWDDILTYGRRCRIRLR